MLITADGTLRSSTFIRHFVGVSLNRQLIREWQFEQTALEAFTFRYVPLSRDGLEQNISQLRESFTTVLGGAARINLEEVAEIQPSASGKILWIVNRLKRGKR